jgi:hypothetical protein
MGKLLLKQAYKKGNEKAMDYLLSYGLGKDRKEMEAEILMMGEDDIMS